MNVHGKLLEAFNKVKRDVMTLKDLVINQNEQIVSLKNTEKELLLRVRRLESQLDMVKNKKPEVKVVEKIKLVKKTVKVATRKTYVGAKTSMKVHDEHCPFAKNINKANKISFKTKVKAFNLGYKACTCLKN